MLKEPDFTKGNLREVAEVRRTGRWVIKRKQSLLSAIDRGEITYAQVLEIFNLPADELDGWRKLINRGGIAALRVTRLQAYR